MLLVRLKLGVLKWWLVGHNGLFFEGKIIWMWGKGGGERGVMMVFLRMYMLGLELWEVINGLN